MHCLSLLFYVIFFKKWKFPLKLLAQFNTLSTLNLLQHFIKGSLDVPMTFVIITCVLQVACWTPGSVAGVCWRMKHFCGSGADRRHSNRAGCWRRAEAPLHSLDATGDAAGSSCDRANSSTTRTTQRSGWKACWTCMKPSKTSGSAQRVQVIINVTLELECYSHAKLVNQKDKYCI